MHIKTCNAILEFPLLLLYGQYFGFVSFSYPPGYKDATKDLRSHSGFLRVCTRALDLPLYQILSSQSPGLTTIIETFLKKEYEENGCQSPCSETNPCKGKLKTRHFKLPKTHIVNPKAGLSYNIAELETESQSRALSAEEGEPGAPCLCAG